MDNRLTRPGIDTDQTAVRFMDDEVKIQDIGDKVLELILNGPTINGVKKDTLRHLVRQLYTELKCYEDKAVEREIANAQRSGGVTMTNKELAHELIVRFAGFPIEFRSYVQEAARRLEQTAPIAPGDSVYWLLEDDGWYISDPEKVADVGTKGFYLSGVRDSDEPGDNPSFIPWDELGKSVFLSREEAEAALEKMKEEK